MKSPSSTTGVAVGLIDWLKQSKPQYSFAIGATCGCDLSRMGRDICDHLNSPELAVGGRCRAFDPDEIRRLAGDPQARHAIFAAAARKGIDLDHGCDAECMVRAIAALGGAVLSGEWAIHATEGMDLVFRVALSHHEHCCPTALLKLDPDGYSQDGLAKIIAKRFVHWMDDQDKGRPMRVPHESSMAMLL